MSVFLFTPPPHTFNLYIHTHIRTHTQTHIQPLHPHTHTHSTSSSTHRHTHRHTHTHTHNFMSDTFVKQGIVNVSSYSRKCNASVVLCDSEVAFLGERGGCSFSSIPLLFCLYIARHDRRSMSKNFLVYWVFFFRRVFICSTASSFILKV